LPHFPGRPLVEAANMTGPAERLPVDHGLMHLRCVRLVRHGQRHRPAVGQFEDDDVGIRHTEMG